MPRKESWLKIAMWSGPRNLSTAMMYSFGARDDCDVMDEPFYGAYLQLTGADHPMRDDILAGMETDPEGVAGKLRGTRDRMLYAKHMTHHMVEGIPRDWFAGTRHAFLIRHPARVVASYQVKRTAPTLEDLGFPQQIEIFEQVQSMGAKTVVVDSDDIRQTPEKTLSKLCDALDIPWTAQMLRWPAGGHEADGIWARHWYEAVHRSTGFSPSATKLPQLEPDLQALCDAAMPYYESLAPLKI